MADTSVIAMQEPEPKKAPKPATPVVVEAQTGWWPAFKQYLRDTVAESKKVAWPSKEDWTNSSVITLLTILTISLIMAGYNAVASYLAAQFFATGGGPTP